VKAKPLKSAKGNMRVRPFVFTSLTPLNKMNDNISSIVGCIQSQLPANIKEQIRLHNVYSRFNSFLYRDKECNQLFQQMFGGEYQQDRFMFVRKQRQMETDLITFVNVSFNNRACLVYPNDMRVDSQHPLKGVIKHSTTRYYTQSLGVNIQGPQQLVSTENDVAFRREYEDPTFSSPETIALWVDIDDEQDKPRKWNSHLYTINRIVLL